MNSDRTFYKSLYKHTKWGKCHDDDNLMVDSRNNFAEMFLLEKYTKNVPDWVYSASDFAIFRSSFILEYYTLRDRAGRLAVRHTYHEDIDLESLELHGWEKTIPIYSKWASTYVKLLPLLKKDLISI